MKKFSILILCVGILCALLVGCGKSDAVKNVERLINNIGTVELSSEQDIKEAKNAYNQLTDKEKQAVENYTTLSSAEKQFKKLQEEEQKRLEEAAKLDITGTWTCTFMGLDLVYVFNSDGTYRNYIQSKIAEGTEGTYVFDGSTLSITHDGVTKINNARKEGGVLIISLESGSSTIDTIWQKQ